MRVFCGLTSVEDGVAAALVNERGGVIATAEVSDDPHGYVDLCRMWVRHVDVACVSVADDGTTEALLRLAAAGGQATGTASDVEGEHGFDAAVRIGRQIAFGQLVCEPAESGYPASIARLVSSMHAMALSRHGSQQGMIELLRQCHPATLMAWPDPTCSTALELLRVLPDPADTAGDVTATEVAKRLRGYADTEEHGELVDSLMTASAEHHPAPDLALADAISAAADAVLACDRANDALADAVNEHLNPRRKPAPRPKAAPPQQQSAPVEEEPRRRANPSLAAAMAGSTRQVPQQREDTARLSPPRGIPREDTSRLSPPHGIPREDTARLSPPRGIPREDTSHLSPSHGLPMRDKPSRAAHAEPVTAPLPPRVEEPVNPRTPSRGFPLMPEPPAFMENEFFTPAHQQPDLPLPNLTAGDALDAPGLPEGIDTDEDLLIFSQARSAWFKGPTAIDETEDDWTSPADEGWRAAASVATSKNPPEDMTGVGLPRRVPQANLVPGSAILSDTTPAPINRDAQTLASHTSGYFKGWSRARRETVGAGVGGE
ncbi:hypothetical protein [Stackebrandtia soli]|uniref:hypothetical protein n=1 Tax=Stackebrandtia soli TaxID=1892856 RepID=UPI0039EA6C5E